jgi:tRNA threonylcarbamoyladenosine biosynthesis protein TsaE
MATAESLNIILNDESDTARLAALLARIIENDALIALIGELGAGKTAFVRGWLAALRATDTVSSPTFVLQNMYQVGTQTIQHWDLYRLAEAPAELLAEETSDLIFVEWADRFPEILERADLTLVFALDLPTARTVTITGPFLPKIQRALKRKQCR